MRILYFTQLVFYELRPIGHNIKYRREVFKPYNIFNI